MFELMPRLMKKTLLLLPVFALLFVPGMAFSAGGGGQSLDQPLHGWVMWPSSSLSSLTPVILEHNIHMRKSKPVIVCAGIIWALVAYSYAQTGDHHTAEHAVKHNILEYGELFLFLLAAMTYINTMDERQVFNKLRVVLVGAGLSPVHFLGDRRIVLLYLSHR